MESGFDEKDFLACCGSTKFAREMIFAAPFANYDQAVKAATVIWFNKVDINGWLEAFAAHPQIGDTSSAKSKNQTSAQWSKGEQSTALATATDSSLQELYEWNSRYRDKFGFVFLICAAGRSTPEILAELKKRYSNRPLVELEIAAQEQMKITELRIAKLFPAKEIVTKHFTGLPTKPGVTLASVDKAPHTPSRTRPPITTHVLDVSRGAPASGVEVHLEKWKTGTKRLSLNDQDSADWMFIGCSVTDSDGRSGPLMEIIDDIAPGMYRISFNTGKYTPGGFYPYVSIVFEVKDTQRSEHFHVPLLLSPFSFSTYRGS